MDHVYGVEGKPGDRVELHPASDLWMQGARFGTIEAVSSLTGEARVKLDKVRRPIYTRADLYRILPK